VLDTPVAWFAGTMIVMAVLSSSYPTESRYANRDAAVSEARQWIADYEPEDWEARVRCQTSDEDGDGFVACTVRTIDSSSWILYCPVSTDSDIHTRMCHRR
jgi:hypothetical protein